MSAPPTAGASRSATLNLIWQQDLPLDLSIAALAKPARVRVRGEPSKRKPTASAKTEPPPIANVRAKPRATQEARRQEIVALIRRPIRGRDTNARASADRLRAPC